MTTLAIRRRLLGSLTFGRGEDGAVMVEALLVLPFITLFAAGILEFGNIFWEKEQIETGLRDAARYLARCQTSPTFVAKCTTTIAANIAFYGSPTAGGALRVPGWGPDASDITITNPSADVIRVSTDHTYVSSPLFGWLNLNAITIHSYHEERYIGW